MFRRHIVYDARGPCNGVDWLDISTPFLPDETDADPENVSRFRDMRAIRRLNHINTASAWTRPQHFKINYKKVSGEEKPLSTPHAPGHLRFLVNGAFGSWLHPLRCYMPAGDAPYHRT